MKDLAIEFDTLKAMNKERPIVKKYKKIQDRYQATRKNFLQQKDDFETQKNRKEAIKRPRNKGVKFSIELRNNCREMLEER